ncbi:MAG: HAMP domain-containing protein [Geobacter sp.]|nr:HAMP domain-containing protein [Geobacter sp.]
MKPAKPGVPILVQLMGICLVMIVVVIGGIYLYLNPLFERELMKDEKRHIQDLVDTTHSIVDDYYRRSLNGEFDTKEAQRLALDRLYQMRYDSTGYFWVNDMTPRMLMHPIQPELNGKDLRNYTDYDGKLLFLEMVRICENDGGGYVNYRWPEPGVTDPVEKISYVKHFAPWGWVIGTGLYTTVIERSLAQMRHDLLLGTVVIILLLAAINIVIAMRIAGPLNRLSSFSARLKEDLSLKAPIEGSRESRQLALALNETAEQLATTLVSRDKLDETLNSLTAMQIRILQSEKMASIGQLAAGVAHEINNPIGFINSNLASLKKYTERLASFTEHLSASIDKNSDDETVRQIGELRKQMKVDRILADTQNLLDESIEGAERVKFIVQNLKDFSRIDRSGLSKVKINDAIDSTINIIWNEIKYVADLNREYGDVPDVVCYPQQINQVFLNLLVNAAHAMGEGPGTITVRSWSANDLIYVAVTDTGCGIPDDLRQRIFEPFFTTKDVGKGTGLGLSISYEIVRKHGGDITVESEVGKGTTFTVILPVSGPSLGQNV